MELKEILLIYLLIAIVLPIVFSLFWFFKIRGEKKISGKETIRTRPSKTLSGFFLGFALLVIIVGLAGIIHSCITNEENTTILKDIIISVCIAAFSVIGFFGYAYYRFNYVVLNSEGILVHKLFRKIKYYRYEEIAYFVDTISNGIIGGLIGYDKNGKKIFAIEALHIGSSAVAQKLREHGVQERH